MPAAESDDQGCSWGSRQGLGREQGAFSGSKEPPDAPQKERSPLPFPQPAWGCGGGRRSSCGRQLVLHFVCSRLAAPAGEEQSLCWGSRSTLPAAAPRRLQHPTSRSTLSGHSHSSCK